MKEIECDTLCKVQSSREAQELIDGLRKAGLHPVELALVTEFALWGAKPIFPVEVPDEEVDAARILLKSRKH